MKNFGPQTWLYPMPVLIIGTYDEKGTPNAMTAAWGGIYNTNQICICLADHKTTENFAHTKAFSVGIGDTKNEVACDYVGITSGNKVPNKVEKAGFTCTKASMVNAPIFNELPMTLECEVVSFKDELLIGNIVNVCAREDVLGQDGKPDINKFRPITYEPVHHKYVELGKEVGNAFVDGKKIK